MVSSMVRSNGEDRGRMEIDGYDSLQGSQSEETEGEARHRNRGLAGVN